MRWKQAWIITRKDLDEFKKQKLVIGSILAMPLVLGVVLPLVIFVPLITMAPVGPVWDVQDLLMVGELPQDFNEPWTNQTLENTSLNYTIIQHAELRNTQLNDVLILSCVVEHSTISNATIRNSTLYDTSMFTTVVDQSKGNELDGAHILAVNSDLQFLNKKPSQLDTILPMMLNMVLMIFIIVPATLPTIIATYSIVGEKNNRSLEPLLATPTTDGELLAGKIFSSFLPSMAATYFAFCIGVILLDSVLTQKLGYVPLPPLTWILAMVFLTPTACIMSVLACVLVSSKVSDVRAAQQLGGFVVMPVVALMLGVLSGFLIISPLTILAAAGLYLCIDLGLFYFVRAVFNREDIVAKWT